MQPYLDAVWRVSRRIEVPGTPRSLRLDRVQQVDSYVRLTWSFLDPERRGRRVREVSIFTPTQGDVDSTVASWWRVVQLTAADRYKKQVDADWLVGEAYVRKVWTPEEAWRALLAHLEASATEVRVDRNRVEVVDRGESTIYRLDPDAWAEYLTDPELGEDSEIVPAAGPMVHGLPIWAVDALDEASGAWGPVIGLVDGELVALESDDHV